MVKNTPKQIRDRRNKIRQLLARGYNQGDTMSELGISTRTYNIDMKNIICAKEFYELAKSNPAKVYSDSANELDEIIKECRKIHNDPKTNPNDKLCALKIISETNFRKLAMFQDLVGNHGHD